MSQWMIGVNDQDERLKLYRWELDKLKFCGEFTYQEAAEKLQGQAVPCYFETENVSFFEVLLPKTNEKKIRLALQSLIEEQLADQSENTFYALPDDYVAGQSCVVAVVATDFITHLIKQLQEVGLKISSLSPDCFLLPCPTEQPVKNLENNRLIIRTSRYQGFAMQHEHALLIMKELEELASVPLGLYEQSPFNFLQDKFLIKPPRKPLTAFQGIFIALGLALILHWLALFIMGIILNKRLEVLQAESLSLYAEIFPGATKVSSAKSLIERELQSRGAKRQEPLVDYLAVLGMALNLQPGAQLQSLDYQEGRLNVSLTLPNMEAVELFNQSLKESGMSAQDQQIIEQGQSVLVQFLLSDGVKDD